MGLGLVTDCNEERWKVRRGIEKIIYNLYLFYFLNNQIQKIAIFNPGFHRTVLLDCLKEFNSKTNILIEKLRLKADGKTKISFYQEINRLTLDIIGSV